MSSLSSASRVPDPTTVLLQPNYGKPPAVSANRGSQQTIAQLRASIAVGGVNLEAMLQRIVDAAQLFTDANGAAIALRQDKWIVCRARAGDMAPDLNSRLDGGSGISGECLRSGQALFCNDTATDPRVNAEACRRLGLRSLAAAPIGEKPRVQGILEAFSAQPDAFGDTELSLLRELAELVTAAQQDSGKAAVVRISKKLAGNALTFSKGKFAVAALVVLAVVLWLGLRIKTRAEHSGLPAASAQPSQPLRSPEIVDSSRQVLQPQLLPVSNGNLKPSPSAGIVMASKTAKVGGTGAVAQPVPEVVSNPLLNVPASRSRLPEPVHESTPVPPQVAIVSGGSTKAIAGLLSGAIVFPQQPAVRLSQGLSGGTLQGKVNPIYPNDALVQRLQGRVTLAGVIAEDGRLRDLKVLHGDPLLARAALQAVSQWRYEPYKLNGEPISRATTITLIFKLP